MLVVENKGAAAKAHVGKAIVRCGCPNAVFLFLESFVDPLFHFLGDLDHFPFLPWFPVFNAYSKPYNTAGLSTKIFFLVGSSGANAANKSTKSPSLGV